MEDTPKPGTVGVGTPPDIGTECADDDYRSIPVVTGVRVDSTPPARVKRERDAVLEEAASIISGDREEQYGSARDGFTRTGRIWAALLDLTEPIEPDLVAVMLSGLKLSRLARDPGHWDSSVDGSGYLALGADIAREKIAEAATRLTS